jgi:tetracycline repressor-like protein
VLELARDQGSIPADVDPETVIEMLIGSYLYRTLSGRPIPKNWPERMVAAVWPSDCT